jgi:hypothetical protein
VPPVISCAELTSMSGGQTMAVESTEPLPTSGGFKAGSLLVTSIALLLGSGVLAYAVLRRR